MGTRIVKIFRNKLDFLFPRRIIYFLFCSVRIFMFRRCGNPSVKLPLRNFNKCYRDMKCRRKLLSRKILKKKNMNIIRNFHVGKIQRNRNIQNCVELWCDQKHYYCGTGSERESRGRTT